MHTPTHTHTDHPGKEKRRPAVLPPSLTLSSFPPLPTTTTTTSPPSYGGKGFASAQQSPPQVSLAYAAAATGLRGKPTITLRLRPPPLPIPTPSYVHIPTSNPFALLPLDVTPPSPPNTYPTLNPTNTKNTSCSTNTKNTSCSTNITNPIHNHHPNVSPSTPSPVKRKRDAVINNQPNKRANRIPKATDFTASSAIKVTFVAPKRKPSNPNPTRANASSAVAPHAQSVPAPIPAWPIPNFDSLPDRLASPAKGLIEHLSLPQSSATGKQLNEALTDILRSAGTLSLRDLCESSEESCDNQAWPTIPETPELIDDNSDADSSHAASSAFSLDSQDDYRLESEKEETEDEQASSSPETEDELENITGTRRQRRQVGPGRRPPRLIRDNWPDDADRVKWRTDVKLSDDIHPTARRMLIDALSANDWGILGSFGRSIDEAYKQDVKRAKKYFVRPPPKVTPTTLLEGYPRSCRIPTPREVENWLLGEAPPLHPTDDLLELDNVHPHVQRAQNLLGRLRATWTSPDLVAQIHLQPGTSEPAPFPQHGPGNVRPVPQAVNLSKGGGLEELNELMLFCILENNQTDQEGNDIAPEDTDRVACIFNRLATLEYMSNERDMLDDDMKRMFIEELARYRNWRDNGDDEYDWRAPLPRASITTLLKQYRGAIKDEDIDRMADQMRRHAAEWADLPVKNADGVPTLFFDDTTPTEQLAALVCGSYTRMRAHCGRKHGIHDADPGLALFRQWVEIIRRQGYRRADGTMGVRDLATNLPTVLGGAHHPLAPSLAAHDRHGEAYSLSGDNANVCLELRWVNMFRGGLRTSGLLAVLDMMRPILQKLRDKMVDRGVLSTRRTLGPPSSRLVSLWSRNHVSSEEYQVGDPEYLPRLEHAWQAHLLSMPPKQGAGPNECTHCGNPRMRGKNTVCKACFRLWPQLSRARRLCQELQGVGGGAPITPIALEKTIEPRLRPAPETVRHGPGAGLAQEDDIGPPQDVKFKRTCALCKVERPTEKEWRTIPGGMYVCTSCAWFAGKFKSQSKSTMPINERQQQHSAFGCQCSCGCRRGRAPGATESDKPSSGRSVCGTCFVNWFNDQMAEWEAEEAAERAQKADKADRRSTRAQAMAIETAGRRMKKTADREAREQSITERRATKAGETAQVAARKQARTNKKAKNVAEQQRKQVRQATKEQRDRDLADEAARRVARQKRKEAKLLENQRKLVKKAGKEAAKEAAQRATKAAAEARTAQEAEAKKARRAQGSVKAQETKRRKRLLQQTAKEAANVAVEKLEAAAKKARRDAGNVKAVETKRRKRLLRQVAKETAEAAAAKRTAREAAACEEKRSLCASWDGMVDCCQAMEEAARAALDHAIQERQAAEAAAKAAHDSWVAKTEQADKAEKKLDTVRRSLKIAKGKMERAEASSVEDAAPVKEAAARHRQATQALPLYQAAFNLSPTSRATQALGEAQNEATASASHLEDVRRTCAAERAQKVDETASSLRQKVANAAKVIEESRRTRAEAEAAEAFYRTAKQVSDAASVVVEERTVTANEAAASTRATKEWAEEQRRNLDQAQGGA